MRKTARNPASGRLPKFLRTYCRHPRWLQSWRLPADSGPTTAPRCRASIRTSGRKHSAMQIAILAPSFEKRFRVLRRQQSCAPENTCLASYGKNHGMHSERGKENHQPYRTALCWTRPESPAAGEGHRLREEESRRTMESSANTTGKLTRYDEWGESRSDYGPCVRPGRPASIARASLLRHIVGAEYVWLTRIRQSSSPYPRFGRISRWTNAEEKVPSLAKGWRDLLSEGNVLDRSIQYRNRQGPRRTTAWCATHPGRMCSCTPPTIAGRLPVTCGRTESPPLTNRLHSWSAPGIGGVEMGWVVRPSVIFFASRAQT